MQLTPEILSLPRSLAVLHDVLLTVQAPAGDFDPTGEWDHSYAVHTVIPANNGKAVNTPRQGSLRLRRAPKGKDRFTLTVDLSTSHALQHTYSVHAEVTCASDTLSSPREWTLTSATNDAEGKPLPDTEATRSGRVRDGKLVTLAPARRVVPAPKALTSSWSLFDALQRLPKDHAEALEFAMLEELDLLKTDQRLAYRQTAEATFAGGPVTLHGYEQLGRGILPYVYWLDDARRLLLAVGGMRAFVWEGSA